MERRVEPDVPEPQRAEHARARTTPARGRGRASCGRTSATTASDEHEDAARVERERRAEMTVHRGDARARHAAERARDAGGGAQRAQRAADAPASSGQTRRRPRRARRRRDRAGRAPRTCVNCTGSTSERLHHARLCLATTMPSSTYSGWPFGGDAGDLRPDPVQRARPRSSSGRASGSVEPAVEELADRLRPRRRRSRTRPSVATASGGTVIGARPASREPGEAVAHDDRARREVAESLVVLRSRRSRSMPTR